MRETETVADARRAMDICNSCRYCEGFCAVFPAMELRRSFPAADLGYLANLCHNCRGCYYACQYAPPHPFGLNLPRIFAELRIETYEDRAWPPALGRVFRRNGLVVSLATALLLALTLLLAAAVRGPVGAPGAFYDVLPKGLLVGLGGAALLFALFALGKGAVNFWRVSGIAWRGKGRFVAPFAALADVATLRNLGSPHGCNDRDESFSNLRRRFHHAMFYGFLACFAATATATIYEYGLGLSAPYPVFSLPVLLGTVGGLGMLVGTAGLFWLKLTGDPAPGLRRLLGGEVALLALLFAIAASGLALLLWRATAAMPALLALHVGLVLAFFLLLPYSRMVHGIYRGLALLRWALERRLDSGDGQSG